jgi:hypothetical protein
LPTGANKVAYVAELQRSPEDARALFHQFQRQNPLSPWGLLKDPKRHSIQLVYVPFWTFQVSGTVSCSGDVGHKLPGSEQLEWKCKVSNVHVAVDTSFDSALTQVAACYHLQQDLLRGLKGGIAKAESRCKLLHLPLTRHDIEAHSVVPSFRAAQASVLPAEMRLAVAWQLASRRLRVEQVCPHFEP